MRLHKAKEDAEKSGLYKKMESGNPDDLFDAAEEYGKVFTKLAEGVLAPKKILPTYQMLVESAKPPLPKDAQALGAGSGRLDADLERPAQAAVSDPEGGWPVHLRASAGERDGHRSPGLAGRSAQPDCGWSWCGFGSKGSTRAGKWCRRVAFCRGTSSRRPRRAEPAEPPVSKSEAGFSGRRPDARRARRLSRSDEGASSRL